MSLRYFKNVRSVTIALVVVTAIAAATYATPLSALGLLAGAAWSLANLALLEILIVALLTPGAASARALPRVAWALGGMALLLLGLAWLLLHLPALWLVAGFSAPLAVIVLKAASGALLESGAWRALAKSPWRAAAVVAALILTAWWLLPARSLGQRADGAAGAHGESAVRDAPGLTTAAHDEAPGAAGEPAAKAEGEDEGSDKFPNVITLITAANHGARWAKALHFWEPIVFSLAVGLLVCITGFVASRNPKMIPGGLQNGAEMLVEKLYEFVGGILGHKNARRFFPLLGTLFVYIFAMNLFGLLPLMDSPTSNLNITFALGLTVFVYVQYVGIRGLGIVGYVDHMLGSPRDVLGWMVAPLMFPIHLMGELAKPISLSCRLFGNVFGEDMLLVGFASLGIGMLSFAHSPVGIPLHAIFFPLALLTSTLQAFVFTVLSTIYILLMLPHEEPGHEEGAQQAH